MTHVNIVDALSAAAVLAMGESNECQPLALIEYKDVEFCKTSDRKEIEIPLEEDLYGPLVVSAIAATLRNKS